MVLQQNSKRIGGKVKPTVRRKVMSQGKNHLAVQDAQSSASAAKKLISRPKSFTFGSHTYLPIRTETSSKVPSKLNGRCTWWKLVEKRHVSRKSLHFIIILNLPTLFLTKKRIWKFKMRASINQLLPSILSIR